jgi:hypothetical protein
MLTDKFVTPITEKEVLEYLSEGLLKAASAAKELAIKEDSRVWAQIALTCANIRLMGLQLAHSRALSRQRTLEMLDQYEDQMDARLEEKRPPKLLIN